MAAELKKNLGIEAVLIPGEKGIFDVIKKDEKPTILFSKHQVGRFPKDGEISQLLKGTK